MVSTFVYRVSRLLRPANQGDISFLVLIDRLSFLLVYTMLLLCKFVVYVVIVLY